MIRLVDDWTIGDLRERHVPLLMDTFSPTLFEFVGLFKKIQAVFDVMVKHGDERPSAIAIALPMRGKDGELRVNFPGYGYVSDDSDATANKFKRRARERKLEFPWRACLVGRVLEYLANPDDSREEDRRLYDNLKEDVTNSAEGRYLRLKAPMDRYRTWFEKAWENQADPTEHLVYPIVLEPGGICAAFAIDLGTDSAASSGLPAYEAILDILRAHLFSIVLAYYADMGARTMPSGWRWDPTGKVLSRRYFEEFSRAVSHRQLLVNHDQYLVLFCDADGLKPVNDDLGHDEGTEVIRLVSSVLSGAVDAARKELKLDDGFVVRYGGDEFLVIFAIGGTGAQAAQDIPQFFCRDVRNRLREAGGDLEESFKERHKAGEIRGNPDGLSRKLGISIGWVEWTRASGVDFKDVWKKADEAMYFCKNSKKLLRKALEGNAEDPPSLRVSIVAHETAQELTKHLLSTLERKGSSTST